uniref:hypothetical protein n=1 Tax=uncultured Draconibacterium sp. TaxID=1573823 RepID=UPI003216FF80
MQILIAHSHLNPGGVTRIIESQIESLPNKKIKVLAGDCDDPESFTSKGAELHIIEELNYLERRKYTDREAMEMLHKVHNELREYITQDCVLHFHNLNLGKNPIVTYAVYLLAKEGLPVFNHTHDFSEDRPTNHQFLKEILSDIFSQDINEVLYPTLTNYHFGVLNSFDNERLISYGVNSERIEWLPNPVSTKFTDNNIDKEIAKAEVCASLNLNPEKLLVTYPVRVVQRKNIGEFILLSKLFAHKANFVVTQPPQNPIEILMYEQWLGFCEKEGFTVTFEAGTKVDFKKLLSGSDFCITTSYKEGFGMVYLEPWLMNTPVVGRNIDFITKDFKEDGFELPSLYYKINIPGLKIDFKDLNMKMQMEVISGLNSGKVDKQKILEQNPILNTLFRKVADHVIDKNKSIIKTNYSVDGYGIKLQKRYKQLVG